MGLRRFASPPEPTEKSGPPAEMVTMVTEWKDLEEKAEAAHARYQKYLDDWAKDHDQFARVRVAVKVADYDLAEKREKVKKLAKQYKVTVAIGGFKAAFADPVSKTLDLSVLSEVPEILQVPGVIKSVSFNMEAVAAAEAAGEVPPLKDYRIERKTTRQGSVTLTRPEPPESD